MNTECNRCKGNKTVYIKLKQSRSGYRNDGVMEGHFIGCPQCNSKGFITDEDRQKYYEAIS